MRVESTKVIPSANANVIKKFYFCISMMAKIENSIKFLLSALIVLFVSISLWGQSLPRLARAQEISQGSFPNGMEYYIVNNPNAKSFTDFTLIRLESTEDGSDRASLSEPSLLGLRKPYKFLSDNGVGYNRNGYIQHLSGATVFSFENVPTYNTAVTDSTIMLIMDIASQSVSPQALVVSGDVDATALKERLNLFSMLVPKLNARDRDSSYLWQSQENLYAGYSLNLSSDIAGLHIMYKSRRTPQEMMNTLQPLMSDSYANILGEIVSSRIKRAFAQSEIPLARSGFRYYNSSASATDELYIFSFHISAKQLSQANFLIAKVFAAIDTDGVSAEEFEAARTKYLSLLKQEVNQFNLSNSQYTAKCVAAYLYGSDLAPSSVIADYMVGRRIPIDLELPIFNSFVKALIDPSENLSLRYDTPFANLNTEQLSREFKMAWNSGALQNSAPPLREFGKNWSMGNDPRLRLSSDVAEPISGGRLWTFANGLKVIYKRLPTSGQFHYALMLSGGIPAVNGIKEGEAAFVSDMLALSQIGGMSGEEFFRTLESKGISISSKATITDFSISGSAPKEGLDLVISALNTIVSDRVVDKKAFEQYRKEEALRISMAALQAVNVNSVMDSLIRPGYAYSQKKNIKRLQNDLPERTEKYLNSAFSRLNDGILIFVGDIDEDALKRALHRTLGSKQMQKSGNQRVRLNSKYISSSVLSRSQKARGGLMEEREKGAFMTVSAPVIYNTTNFEAFKIAASYIKDELVRALADSGAYVKIGTDMESFPAERMNLYIDCRPCIENGLPSGVLRADPQKLMSEIQKVVKNLSEISLDNDKTNAYKAALLLNYEKSRTDPDTIINDIILRYGSGKDMVSGRAGAINALNNNTIKEILTALSQGLRVEYTVY